MWFVQVRFTVATMAEKGDRLIVGWQTQTNAQEFYMGLIKEDVFDLKSV